MHIRRRLIVRPWLLTPLALSACGVTTTSRVSRVAPVACDAALRWAPAESGARILRVALAVEGETVTGWDRVGTERVARALDSWNRVGLPLRLVLVDDLATAEVRVLILRRLPAESSGDLSASSYRAGLTRLTFDERRLIARAYVAVAEGSPQGVAYSVEDQMATLLHEIGHSLGLPHVDQPASLMAERHVVGAITPIDAQLARAVYQNRRCESRPIARR